VGIVKNLKEKIKEFAELVEKEQLERLKKDGLLYLLDAKVKVKEGKKYTKVDIGGSGKFMIDSDGNIFGIKAYGVIHKGHRYGTLDSIDEWYWGEYSPVKKVRGQLESYQELKQRQQKELNEFEGIFFAFSNEQFNKGMKKIGLLKEDTGQIFSLGAGGYILKTKSKAFNDLFKRHADEKKKRNADEKFIFESLCYELNNHEFCITGDPTEALEALELNREDVPVELLKKAMAEEMVSK